MRPGGPGWTRQRERTGVLPAQDLVFDLKRSVAASLLLFGTMFAVGAALLLRGAVFGTMLGLAVAGGLWLWRLRRRAPAAVEKR